MTEPLSIAASVVGIIVPALHGTRLLLDDLEKLKDAPETVRRLKDEVRSIDMSLTSLRAVEDQEWKSLGTSVAEESRTTISTCTRACDMFRTDIQRWTRHSGDGKLAWQDRANVGFFKQGRIKTMWEQLHNCKVTINCVVGIATL
jgi:Fungal N-terminal domain of STAND proteins